MPRVRFTDETEDQEWLQLNGLTDRVYINTHNDTGVEVGTGCTVFLRDMSPLGVTGFSDRAVFNPWKENDKDNYRWYAGLAIGAIGKLIRIEPETKHTSVRFAWWIWCVLSPSRRERAHTRNMHCAK